MPLTQAVVGSQTNADAYFYQNDGVTPFVGTTPAAYVVRTQNNLLITSGTAQQDPNNSAHWLATFTIPTTAPTTNSGEFYSITWFLSNKNNQNTQTSYFTVSSQIQTDPTDTAILVLYGQPFTINFTVPYATLDTLTLRLVDMNGAVVTTPPVTTNLSNPTAMPNGKYLYQIYVDYNHAQSMVIPGVGISYYFAYVNYITPNGTQETEIIIIYIVNTLCLGLMNNIRRYVDRIRNNDILPQLRITDIDLMHFTMQGVEYINMIPPSNVLFNLQNLPSQFQQYAMLAGSMRLLEAQYLAQGMTAVDFAGQAVTLTQDVTQYIMQMVDLIRSDLQNVGLAKNHFARSGGLRGQRAAIGGTWGPVSNLVFRVSPYSMPTGWPSLPFLQ